MCTNLVDIFYIQFTLLLALTLSLVAMVFLLNRKSGEGKGLLLLCLSSSLLWLILETLLFMPLAIHTKILITQLQYLAIASAPMLYVLYCFHFLGLTGMLQSRRILSFFIIPLLTIVLAWTNGFHHLIWTSMAVISYQGIEVPKWSHGPMFYVYLIYCYCFISVSVLLCIRKARKLRNFFRYQALLIGLGALVPLVANIFYSFDLVPVKPLDTTPLAFSITNIILSIGFLLFRLEDLRPIARDTIFKGITDGLMVSNMQGDIVYMNTRLKALLDLGKDNNTGLQEDLVFNMFPELRRKGPFAGQTIYDPVYKLYFDVSKTLLTGRRRKKILTGKLYLFRDITQRKLLEEELRHLAQEDLLTGLFNRRSFLEQAEREMERVKRHGGSLSMLMVDLDRFKNINDRYGHQAGDYILKSFGGLCKELMRSCDLGGRLGGEEFGLLLPETDKSQALIFANRLRETFYSSPFTYEDITLEVSLSGGVAQWEGKDDSLENLIRRADKKLYQAKDEGRNRIC